MLMALAMLALVAATLLLLSRHFAYQVTRTRLAAQDAQLSQLLLAGAQDATQRSKTWPQAVQPAAWQIELPKVLADSGAKLSVELKASQIGADATIEARTSAGIAIETLHFRRADGAWTVGSAELAGAESH
jgi:hypothetical protein